MYIYTSRKSHCYNYFALFLSIIIFLSITSLIGHSLEGTNTTEAENNSTTNQTAPELIQSIISIILNTTSIFSGELLSIKAHLNLLNGTPLPNQSLEYYKNSILLSSNFTDNYGASVFQMNTAYYEPGNYALNITFNGNPNMHILPSFNDTTTIEILPKKTTPNESAQSPRQKSFAEIILSTATAYIYDIIKINTKLTYENNTPIPNKNISYYLNETLIGIKLTNEKGKSGLNFNTENTEPGTYKLNLNYTNPLDSHTYPLTVTPSFIRILSAQNSTLDESIIFSNPWLDKTSAYQNETVTFNITIQSSQEIMNARITGIYPSGKTINYTLYNLDNMYRFRWKNTEDIGYYSITDIFAKTTANFSNITHLNLSFKISENPDTINTTKNSTIEPTNPCASITCPDKCIGLEEYANGTCNNQTGTCDYTITENSTKCRPTNETQTTNQTENVNTTHSWDITPTTLYTETIPGTNGSLGDIKITNQHNTTQLSINITTEKNQLITPPSTTTIDPSSQKTLPIKYTIPSNATAGTHNITLTLTAQAPYTPKHKNITLQIQVHDHSTLPPPVSSPRPLISPASGSSVTSTCSRPKRCL